ncbi:MAG: hypothetical protein JO210_05055 [Acidobacteriaceae bacterium]|nr:hypothetical protein [Acidobacteriaceae bacterium]
MNIGSKLSGHWTDDQLIAYLYDVGLDDGHLHGCRECQARLSVIEGRQEALRSSQEVDFEFLAGQRRRIYAKITQPVRWGSRFQLRRWASAGAALFIVGGGLLYYEEHHRQQTGNSMLSDAQLAQDVSRMSENSEAQPTAPLQALFEE